MNTILTLLSPDRLKEHYQAGHWRDETLYSIVRGHARSAPEAIAIRDRVRSVTYRSLIDATDVLAADLHRRGVRPGQRVAVWTPSRVETAVTMLACSRNGYVCCPSLHRDHTVGDIVGLLTRMGAVALIAEENYGADADRRDLFASAANLKSLHCIYRLDPFSEDNTRAIPFHGHLNAAASQDLPNPAPVMEPDTVMYLAFTSGTTGAPKGVMHSDNTLLANSRAIVSDWNMTTQSVIYTLSPLSHNLGFGAMINALTVGATLVLHDLPKGASLIDRLAETQATFLFGVPTHAIDLLNELHERGQNQLPHLTGFRISGAPIPGEVCEQLLAFGITPQSGYGMTEACSHHYTLPHDDPSLIVDSSGRACQGYEVKIWTRDNPNLEAPTRQIGQIGGRGASLMLGYFDDQSATESSFNADGWFMTGDLGWVDEDGYLRVTGRKKDVIIRGGHNIYPARIEALALRHRGIAQAAALPVDDARLGERVCLAIVPRDGVELTSEQVLQHLDDAGLSKYDMPEFYLELDEVPLSPSGKVLKRDLVELIRNKILIPRPIRFRPKTATGEAAGASG